MLLIYLQLLLILISLPMRCYSQSIRNDTDCKNISNKKALKLYSQAIEKLNYDPEDAYQLLIEAVEAEPEYIDALYVLADINYQNALKAINDVDEKRKLEYYYSEAEKYFNKVIELCPSFNNFFAYYYLGYYYYYYSKNYEKSKEYLHIFLENNDKSYNNLKKSVKIVKHIDIYYDLLNNPVPFEPTSLKGICTKEDEYLPLISPDDKYIFFTHRYIKKSKNSIIAKNVEELTFSEVLNPAREDNEEFSAVEPMPFPFNEKCNQGGIAITIDNNHLFITICDFVKLKGNFEPYNNCDIYTSDIIDGKWSDLKNLGPNINDKNTWESQPSISADGKTLYFASIREGGYGGMDIYYSVKDENGKWGKAKNIGPLINTEKNEKSPFIHSDSQTLYFSSDGRYGLGGYDIYFSKLSAPGGKDNWEWSEPVNIGHPINTENDDLGLIVSTDGSKAYFSSNKLNTEQGWDIYSFNLYNDARPEKVLFIKGKLIDDKGDVLIDASVELKSAQTSNVTEGMVDKYTGRYAVATAVKKDEEFIMTVKKQGYSFSSKYIKPDDEQFEKPATIDFEVKPIEVGTTVELNDIYFATNSPVFYKSSMVVLDNFIEFLEDNPTVNISIHGHTDNVGDEKNNLILSEYRAKAVRDYLVLFGISTQRILSYKGFGETHPVATNNTPEGKSLNRRTEFVIVEK